MAVGNRLKELRKALNLTQKDVAAKLKSKIDYSYIGKIEREEQNPSLKILKKIADAMSVDLEYFFSNTPLSYYLNKNVINDKTLQLQKMCSKLDEKDMNFIIEIIKLMVKHNKLNNDSKYTQKRNTKILKAADKKKKYKK